MKNQLVLSILAAFTVINLAHAGGGGDNPSTREDVLFCNSVKAKSRGLLGLKITELNYEGGRKGEYNYATVYLDTSKPESITFLVKKDLNTLADLDNPLVWNGVGGTFENKDVDFDNPDFKFSVSAVAGNSTAFHISGTLKSDRAAFMEHGQYMGLPRFKHTRIFSGVVQCSKTKPR